MTPEAQRIALAELDGWKRSKLWPFYWEHPTTGVAYPSRPDYPRDLNELHELAKRLPDKLQRRLGAVLFNVCEPRGIYVWICPPELYAEAVLRTVGKWEESKS